MSGWLQMITKNVSYTNLYKQGDLGENIQSYGVSSMVFSTKDSQSTENPCIDSEPDWYFNY